MPYLDRLAPPAGEILPSYVGNIVRIEHPTGPFDLVPTTSSSDVPQEQGPLYVVGSWNPFGRPTTASENAGWEAVEDVNATGRRTQFPAAIYHPELLWSEKAVALFGRTEQGVASWAWRYGQPAFFRWDGCGLSVIRTDDLSVVATWAVERRPLSRRSCVMEPNRSTPCVRAGGRWVRASMEAALIWQCKQAVMMSALRGCDVCQGVPSGQGRSIGLVSLSVSSRWSPDRPVVVGP